MTARLEMHTTPPYNTVSTSRPDYGRGEIIPSHIIQQARALDIVIGDRNRRMQLSPHEQIQEDSSRRVMVQYDGNFDLTLYDEAYAIQDEQERQKRLEILDGYIRMQLRTHLGERLNVLLSSITYQIDSDGDMYEPTLGKVVAMVHVGAEHQLHLDVNEIDIPRLLADTPEMELIQQTLCNPDTPVGTMMIALSPPGGRNESTGQESLFLHNFVDIFRLEEIDGKRIITLYRYASALTYEEDLHRLIQIKQDYFQQVKPGEDLVAFFLRHPLLTSGQFHDPEDVHRFFQSENQFMTTSIFEEVILPGCQELIERYICVLHAYGSRSRRLTHTQEMVALQHATFNMLLIKVDELTNEWERLQAQKQDGSLSDLQFVRSQNALIARTVSEIAVLSDFEIIRDGRQENVQQKGGDCPGKSGMATASADLSVLAREVVIANNTSPFGGINGLEVDEYGSTHFTCTQGHPCTRPLHVKIPKCPTCEEPFTC